MTSRLISIVAVAALTANFVQSKLPTENLFFYETFDGEDPFASGKWTKSSDIKYADQPVMVKTLSKPLEGFENDKGLQLTQEMKHYGFSSKFPTPLETKGKDIVLQYELKLEEGLTCGGAYVKMPLHDVDLSKLNSKSKFSIMFGPDKCGTFNKVHLILQYQNPISKRWGEMHYNTTIPIKTDKIKFHLYTFHLKSNNDFEIYIDMKSAGKGNLLTHLDPPINPAKEIEDKDDRQPTDWVVEESMSDPGSVKPEDWDEEAPMRIEDVTAVKPAGWGDHAASEIQDPDSRKPEDWDDEEDGEWMAPMVPNPLCEEVGCGPWTPPTLQNPDYKGKWMAPQIPNPAYKGKWSPRMITNPNYFTDLSPASSLAPMAGLAVEIWTTNAGIFFDNFVVSHTLKDAFNFADATFSLKSQAEARIEQADKKAREQDDARREKDARLQRTDFISKAQTKIEEIIVILKANAFISLGSFFVVALTLVLGLLEAQNSRMRRLKRQARAEEEATATAAATAAAQ